MSEVADEPSFCTCSRPSYTQERDPGSDFTGEWVCGDCRKPSKLMLQRLLNELGVL